VVLEVSIPREWLKRHGNPAGLWRVGRDIPPERFRGIFGFRELSRSPAAGAGR
jgi:hypothetical protein